MSDTQPNIRATTDHQTRGDRTTRSIPPAGRAPTRSLTSARRSPLARRWQPALSSSTRPAAGGGGAPDTAALAARYREGDPLEQVPLDVPVRCVHGRDDSNVPPNQSASYVKKATATGADATVTMVDGDHFTLIDPTSAAWTTTMAILDRL